MYGALGLPLIEDNDSFSIRITNTVRIGKAAAQTGPDTTAITANIPPPSFHMTQL
jgi:hypothetical protein